MNQSTASTPEQQRHLYLQGLVMRQTDYDETTADQKLLDHNNDILAIVREYMGPPAEQELKPSTTNQQIFTEIRTMMDDAAATYRVKKALEERREALLESAAAQRAIAAQNLRNASIGDTATTPTDASCVSLD